MLKVEVRHGNVDRALKILRRKVKLTKQTLFLREKRNYIKKSSARRLELQKAVHKQKMKDQED